MAWFPDVHVPPLLPPLREGPVLRWGVLAPGGIAEDFTATLLANTDQQITAVASRSAERAGRFASRLAIGRAHGSYEQLVSDPEVDVVYLAAPHSEHRALSLLAIASGKNVLIEKPIAVSATQGMRDSPLHSLDDAISVMRTVDAVRVQLGEVRTDPDGKNCPDPEGTA